MNDQIAVEKFSKLVAEPSRGDLVVFSPPKAFYEAKGLEKAPRATLIKRVVAVEGDIVAVFRERQRTMQANTTATSISVSAPPENPTNATTEEETSTTTATDQTNRILFSEKNSKHSQEDDTNTTTKLVVEEEETETLDIAPISEVCSKLFPDVNSSSSGDDDDDDDAKRKKNFMESQLSEQEDDDDDEEEESAQKSITVARLRTQPNFSSTTMSNHDDDDDDSDTMNQESGSRDMIPSDSQASFVRRTNAAEVLAVMAGISN